MLVHTAISKQVAQSNPSASAFFSGNDRNDRYLYLILQATTVTGKYKSYRYETETRNLSSSLSQAHHIFNQCVIPKKRKVAFGDGTTYVWVGKFPNKLRIILRTKSNNGPTLEVNMNFPKESRKGKIIKIRLCGKLTLIHLF